jgi:hypothetical protein
MYFDAKSIQSLRKTYNQEHPREQPIQGGDDPEKIWSEIRRRLHEKCKTGSSECILTALLTKPKAPSEWKVNPEEWLSTDDIETLEKQYEKLFGNYKFIGTFPMDFDLKSETGKCLISALCSMDIRKLAGEGKTQIGIVFNTDVSSGPGEHWVAVFCDLRSELEYPRMTYFDSYGQSPEKEIKTLMKRWKQAWDASGVHSKPMVLSYNKTRHQYKESECGMYCLYFHYCCLTGISMDERIPDDVVNGLRKLLFKA